MDKNSSITTLSKQRITSIDALRAFTLLGILIVHANNGFGFPYEKICISFCDHFCSLFNALFLNNKCNTIFASLFGVSFYIILRNPKNSSIKFVWRCFLLALIGLFNKLFYSFDALMWYGLCGMVLVLFRNLKPRSLIISCVCLLLINSNLARFNIGTLLFGDVIEIRYGIDKSICDVLSYPIENAVADYLRIVLNGGGLATLAKFIFGYWVAKNGFIEYLQERLTKQLLLTIWAIFLALFFSNYFLAKYGIQYNLMTSLNNYFASIAYASALLYAYYHCGLCNRILSFFEPYGRLGLTNYSMCGIFGVIFINEFGLGLYKYPLILIVSFFIGFFLLQAVFSYFWLRYFTYGPMEYVWRVATERKKIPLLRNQETRLKV